MSAVYRECQRCWGRHPHPECEDACTEHWKGVRESSAQPAAVSAGASGRSVDAMDIATEAMLARDAGIDMFSVRGTLALAIDALVQRKVEEERERCCRAVCRYCAEGNQPRPARDYDQPMHLFQGYPPRTCAASALRTPPPATRG